MSTPRRIQIIRRKGFRLPEGAVPVARGSIFGNPFRIEEHGRVTAKMKFEQWTAGEIPGPYPPDTLLAHLESLRGKDLACHCEADRPCHADVLLRLANAPLPEVAPSDSEYVDSLDDVPVIKGPLVYHRAYLILPPYNWEWIAAAYAAANWEWTMTAEERIEFWKVRPKTGDNITDYLTEVRHGIIPSAERIRATIERAFDEHRINPKAEWGLSGGYLTFRGLSGRLGFFLEDTLGEHYSRIKAAALANSAAPSQLELTLA